MSRKKKHFYIECDSEEKHVRCLIPSVNPIKSLLGSIEGTHKNEICSAVPTFQKQ